ncbi:MAG: hypothetical protein FWE46_06895 [Coriobacteriia bacterium]|nr:hypothetical protein [Coriobacteriia bacterium]
MKLFRPICLILTVTFLCAMSLFALGCSDDPRVFDPHVGTWEGQTDAGRIRLEIVPGGVLSYSNLDTQSTQDYAYWTRFEQEGEQWQLGIGVYPLGGDRESRFLLIAQSSQSPDVMMLEASPEGQELLGFSQAQLQRIP